MGHKCLYKCALVSVMRWIGDIKSFNGILNVLGGILYCVQLYILTVKEQVKGGNSL